MTKSLAGWMGLVQPYIAEWTTATAHVWQHNEMFDLNEFNAYLRWYMSATRIRIMALAMPDETPEPTAWDGYPVADTSGSRTQAVKIYFRLLYLLLNLILSNTMPTNFRPGWHTLYTMRLFSMSVPFRRDLF